MIKDNQKRLNRLHVVIDALVIAAAYTLSWFVFIGSHWFLSGREALPPQIYLGALAVIIPG